MHTLLMINEIKKHKNYELAEKLGVTPETISRGISGKHGSNQLLKGLELLLENIQMRERLEKIENAQRTLSLLTGPSAPFIMNDAHISTANNLVSPQKANPIYGSRIVKETGKRALKKGRKKIINSGKTDAEIEALADAEVVKIISKLKEGGSAK